MSRDKHDGGQYCVLDRTQGCAILRLAASESNNVLSQAVIASLRNAVETLRDEATNGGFKALIITGNESFFSVGADLKEITQLTAPAAFEFSPRGQELMQAIDVFPVPVIAAIRGYCMGGGMDLALACDYRIAAPNAVFGHRGASLGVITGWGGTQRLPRLIGKARALQMFLLAEMIKAEEAMRIGLVNAVADDPTAQAYEFVNSMKPSSGLDAASSQDTETV